MNLWLKRYAQFIFDNKFTLQATCYLEIVIYTFQVKWVNKQRVLVFSARGITQRDRHLMVDLRDMMPHSKTESKFERKDPLFVINEVV